MGEALKSEAASVPFRTRTDSRWASLARRVSRSVRVAQAELRCQCSAGCDKRQRGVLLDLLHSVSDSHAGPGNPPLDILLDLVSERKVHTGNYAIS